MGRVWLARDEASGVDVALKEVRLDTFTAETDRRTQLSRAWLEALHALSVAKSSNIVKILDVFEEDGRPWIVMELVIGRTLAQAVAEQGRLPPLQVAHIGKKVLMALTACHVKQIVHRDVKPSNILLADDGRVLLTDFGIAAGGGLQDAALGSLTPAGIAVGTPEYMAPERVKGRPATAASDLFSLGATLYFAVEGRSPFRRDSFVASSAAVLFDPAGHLQHGRVFDQLLSGLLAKDPADRTQTGEAYEQLMRIIASDGAIPVRKDVRPIFDRPGAMPRWPAPRTPDAPPAGPAPGDPPPGPARRSRFARLWRAVGVAAMAVTATLAANLFLLRSGSSGTSAPSARDTAAPAPAGTDQPGSADLIMPPPAPSASSEPLPEPSVQCLQAASGVALKAAVKDVAVVDIRSCLPMAARSVLQMYPIGTCLADNSVGPPPVLSYECGQPVSRTGVADRLVAVWLASSRGGPSTSCQGFDISPEGGHAWLLWTDGVVWSLCGIGA